jgi:hypothetical protein
LVSTSKWLVPWMMNEFMNISWTTIFLENNHVLQSANFATQWRTRRISVFITLPLNIFQGTAKKFTTLESIYFSPLQRPVMYVCQCL